MAALTRAQDEALRCLDWCCWDDSETGGDGWCDILRFAEGFGVGYERASTLLRCLLATAYVERRLRDGPYLGHRRLYYALTEQGAQYTSGNLYRASLPAEQGRSEG